MPTARSSKRQIPAVEFTLWLEFELWQPMPEIGAEINVFDPEDDFCNISITLATGERYALNVWTYNFLTRAHQGDSVTGENLGGEYLLPPDLFVARLDRQLFQEVIADLIRRGGLRPEWRAGFTDEPPRHSPNGTHEHEPAEHDHQRKERA